MVVFTIFLHQHTPFEVRIYTYVYLGSVTLLNSFLVDTCFTKLIVGFKVCHTQHLYKLLGKDKLIYVKINVLYVIEALNASC